MNENLPLKQVGESHTKLETMTQKTFCRNKKWETEMNNLLIVLYQVSKKF